MNTLILFLFIPFIAHIEPKSEEDVAGNIQIERSPKTNVEIEKVPKTLQYKPPKQWGKELRYKPPKSHKPVQKAKDAETTRSTTPSKSQHPPSELNPKDLEDTEYKMKQEVKPNTN